MFALVLNAIAAGALVASMVADRRRTGAAMRRALGAFARIVPGFVAFPLAAALLRDGAGVHQVILFVSTSTTVSVPTLPLEANTFGRRVALTRNALSLVLSAVSAAVLGAVLG